MLVLFLVPLFLPVLLLVMMIYKEAPIKKGECARKRYSARTTPERKGGTPAGLVRHNIALNHGDPCGVTAARLLGISGLGVKVTARPPVGSRHWILETAVQVMVQSQTTQNSGCVNRLLFWEDWRLESGLCLHPHLGF